jgi:addiction module RelE/StbE family toxin
MRSVKVRYRQRALGDIQNIFDYIGERNPRAATEIVTRIRRAAEGLGEWPLIGHSGRQAGTYEWVVVGSPYIIVYEIIAAADEVAIIAVFHGAQNRDG